MVKLLQNSSFPVFLFKKINVESFFYENVTINAKASSLKNNNPENLKEGSTLVCKSKFCFKT